MFPGGSNRIISCEAPYCTIRASDGYIIVEINKCNCKIKRLPQRRRPGEQLIDSIVEIKKCVIAR
jgi:hypothetical protein